MKASIIILGSAALITAIAAAFLLGIRETRQAEADPKPAIPALVTNEAPAERAPATDGIAARADRNQQLALAIERALVARDPQQRETAFNFILPELLELAPDRVIAMVARQEPGEARDALRDEVARHWITRDRDAAIAWMKSFDDEGERKASATIATRTLAAVDRGRLSTSPISLALAATTAPSNTWCRSGPPRISTKRCAGWPHSPTTRAPPNYVHASSWCVRNENCRGASAKSDKQVHIGYV